MPYHLLISTKSKKDLELLDQDDLESLKRDILSPFVRREGFQVSGYFLEANDVSRLLVTRTDAPSSKLVKDRYAKMPRNVILAIRGRDCVAPPEPGAVDMTKQVLDELRAELTVHGPAGRSGTRQERPGAAPGSAMSKVFIVHGHDGAAKEALARFVEKLGLEAVVLHETTDGGRTVIEKLERESEVSFAVVLLTPDDEGRRVGDPAPLQSRARQNVVLELGYFMGRLGRDRVAALVRPGVEMPSDYHGVVYTPLDPGGAWRLLLAREMRAAGLLVDLNRAI